MINLRYHIVSITAVFLALGLGLTMGSTFLDRATVESLNNQLDGLETDLGKSDTRIDELENGIETRDADSALFDEQGLGPLLAGELADVPVVVFAVRGTNEQLVDRGLAALSASGADVHGTWWVTDRFALDDEAERRDLTAVLGIETDSETRLRRTVTLNIATDLLERMAPVLDPTEGEPDAAATDDTVPADATVPVDGSVPPGGASAPEDTVPPADEVEAPAAVPALITSLSTAGFLEFEPLGDGDLATSIPSTGARIVIIADASASLTVDQFLVPVVENLTTPGPASLVVASGLVNGDADALRGLVVDPIRADPNISDLLSTVDHLDRFAGSAALVLALEAAVDGRTAHFGVAPTATRLLPAADGPT